MNVKSRAKDRVMEDFGHVLGAEFDEVVGSEHARRDDFIKFIKNHSNVTVTNVRQVTGDHYLVSMRLHTITGEVRHTLLGIFKPIEGRAMNSFNFSDAISLLHQKDRALKIEADQTLDVEVSND